MNDLELQNAKNIALNYLSYKSRTQKEVEKKLLDKKISKEVIEKVIDFLLKYNYLNDEEFVEEVIKHSKKSKRVIYQKLLEKGVSKELIEEKLKEISDEDEEEKAFMLSKKKLVQLKNIENIKKKKKINDFLLRKGFSYNIINRVLIKLFKGEVENDI